MAEDYRGFITYCFSDWEADTFERAPMVMRNGERTDTPLRSSLEGLIEGMDYYLKPDPDFAQGTYSRCHRKLREQIRPGDYIFFRTNHRDRQFLIGYFRIKEKIEGKIGPILVADPDESQRIDFEFELHRDNWDVVERLNPRAVGGYDPDRTINRNMMFLGRDYLILDRTKKDFLLGLLSES